MNALNATLKLAVGGLATALLAACASDSKSPAPVDATRPAISQTSIAYSKLSKGLTGAQVRELLGAPAGTKPLTGGGANTQIWSYPLRTITEVKPVPVATQEVPAVNPLTGQSTTRTETIFQNQTVEGTEILHLLMVDDRLIEWKTVRTENSEFH